MKSTFSAIAILIHDRYGIYIPQAFAKDYDLSVWSNINKDDINILHKGPYDNDLYWDAWDTVLNNAVYENNGHVWRLYQDGDLFAICEELMTDSEYRDFFGEERYNNEQDRWYDTSAELS